MTGELIWEYLANGDLLGFFYALFVQAFGYSEFFWAMLTAIFTGIIYIKTQSVLLVSCLFLLVGMLLLASMPMITMFAIALMALGVGGIFWRLFTNR